MKYSNRQQQILIELVLLPIQEYFNYIEASPALTVGERHKYLLLQCSRDNAQGGF